MLKAALQSSEFWTALLGAVLQVLVNQNLIPPDQAQTIQQIVTGLLVYAFGRLVSKTVKGQLTSKGTPSETKQAPIPPAPPTNPS